jgi:hypothetical protein
LAPLLNLRAEEQDTCRLKQILDRFALASILKMNFSKSTLILMNVDNNLLPKQ